MGMTISGKVLGERIFPVNGKDFFNHEIWLMDMGGGKPQSVRATSNDGKNIVEQDQDVTLPIYIRPFKDKHGSPGYEVKLSKFNQQGQPSF